MPAVSASQEVDYDLLCVGFGPAALAIAVAIHDLDIRCRVVFLEKQDHFAWHSGMLLPGAKMQISFLKDLATFRDPRSYFTFLNFLKENDRLEAFTNLSTFLPQRREFSEYLTWAADHFEHQVQYSTAAESIDPLVSVQGKVSGWRISANQNDVKKSYTTRRLVIATGGNPQLPDFLQNISRKIIHSSHYLYTVPSQIPINKAESDLNLVVVGGGQSSAETFNDLTTRYPQAKVTLYTSASALKPSDDSPFVNEIFNPSLIDTIYALPPTARTTLTTTNKATNYSVVRPELLDHLYEAQYNQRLDFGNDESGWRHRIIGSRRLIHARNNSGGVTATFEDVLTGAASSLPDIDLLVCGTGYDRNGHETLLAPVQHLLASEGVSGMSDVERDYRLKLRSGAVEAGCGIWLQGVCEGTHGLSDSLLSILAVRAGEVVESVFASKAERREKVKKASNGVKAAANGYLNGVNGLNGMNGKSEVNGLISNGTH